MPRKLRVEYPGATYHVMSRGNRREDIFLNDVDRHNFIKTLAEACQKTGWQVHAYCLMRNHYHLLLETPNANLISERRMEARRLEEADREALRGLQRSWCLGDKEFKKEMLAKMEGKLGEHHSGELLHETAQAKSDWIVDEELRRLGWNEADLANRPRSDPAKLAIASRLRKETTLTIKAIAARAHLGTSKSANARLHSWMGQVAQSHSPEQVRE